ncbi:MAG TPA: hypothetical protein VM870_02965 [Pyrinomonadaceae bacterium]|nr:hypothetical protein [Pyrinomonadaceae bacterium]
MAGGSACQNQPAEVSTNVNTNLANANVAVSATPATVDPGASVAAREPEKYVATLVLTAQTTGGDKAVAIPQLSAEVARDGADRRIAFKLPNNEQLIYVDRADMRYVIAPNRKQYAELTRESTGFDIPRMMTPAQIVAQMQKLRGYQAAGEEQVGGRTALKYTYAGTSNTGTQAGNVKAEAYVYVDKETGLPLRSEITSEAEGNVQGVKGLKVITEMRDIKSEVDPAMFEIPQGYSKVSPEEVRGQINAFMAIAQAILQNVLAQSGNANNAGTTTNTAATPAATMAGPTPAP